MPSLKTFGLALVALLLASCSVVQSDPPPPLSFTRYQPILLNVGTIDFVEEYKSPMKPPYVEHLMPYSPTEAMRIWVKDRIRATGSEHTLQVIIKDARVLATKAEKNSGVLGFMRLTSDKRYDLSLTVEMRIYGRESAMSEASLNVSTTRTIHISDITPVHEKNVRFQQMIADAMESINAELEKNMFSYFGSFITYQ